MKRRVSKEIIVLPPSAASLSALRIDVIEQGHLAQA